MTRTEIICMALEALQYVLNEGLCSVSNEALLQDRINDVYKEFSEQREREQDSFNLDRPGREL